MQADRLLKAFREERRLSPAFLPHNPRLPLALRWVKSIKYLRTVVTSVVYMFSLLFTVSRYDVIHVFSASYYSFLLSAAPAILIAKIYGKSCVLNYRSGEAEDHMMNWRRTAIPIMRLADVIIVPSGYLVEVFARFGLHAISISNTVDTTLFKFRKRSPLRPVFLSNRNLEPLYNVGCILRAFAIIQERYPEARLVVAGDGSQRASLERLAASLRLCNTEFVGRIQPNRMKDLYRAADIYLNSSIIDNMPGSILESFASGLPVVTTNAGGIPYIVTNERTGLMVRCGDEQAIASSALRLLEEPGLAARLIQNALDECERYEWKTIRKQWLELYDRLAAHDLRTIRSIGPDFVKTPEVNSVPSLSPDLTIEPPRSSVKPLRVLIVAPSMNILGGQSIQAGYLRDWLKNIDSLDVSMLPINPMLPSPFRLLQRVKYLRTALTSAMYCWMLMMKVRRCDVVHVFSASYFSFILSPTPAILIGSLFRKKVVLNYHSGEAEDHLESWRRTAVPTLRLADEIVVPSGYLVDVFSKFGLRARAISNTVDTGLFTFRERNPLRPVFLSNRNLERLYNVGCILRAFAIIQSCYPESRLIVAGDGKDRAALEKLAADLRLDNTEFVGRVTPETMKSLYDAADIYLNSSNIDNMPGSILESFASGLPVVTTDAGGIPYIVDNGKTGLLVKRGDVTGLAAGAIRLLADPQLANSIICNAREECRKYRWSVVCEDWLRLYSEVSGRAIAPPKSQPEDEEEIESPLAFDVEPDQRAAQPTGENAATAKLSV